MRIKVLLLTAIILFTTNLSNANTVKDKTTAPQGQQSVVEYKLTKSLDIVNNPHAYLNKYVKIQARFNRFSTLGLDYKPVMRKSQDYLSFLINRDDVTTHTVPLSEMKIFIKRSEAEKYIDLDSGDKIEFEAKVVSTALGDPWLDATKIKVLEKKNKDQDKSKEKTKK